MGQYKGRTLYGEIDFVVMNQAGRVFFIEQKSGRLDEAQGQQAAAVVLTDVDPRETRLAQELQILFCGLTRATVRLEIVCNAGNPNIQERILQHL